MNKYAKLYFGSIEQKTAAGLGGTLLKEAPVITKGLTPAAKSVGNIAQDAGKSIWSNSKGLLNSASNFVANKTKPIANATENLVPDAAGTAPSVGKVTPKSVDIAGAKKVELQQSGATLPEHVQPGSEREAVLNGRPLKPTLDPAVKPEPVGPVKGTEPAPAEAQVGAKPMANKSMLDKLPQAALPLAAGGAIAGGAAALNSSIPNAPSVPAAKPTGATPQANSNFGSNPFSTPFAQGPQAATAGITGGSQRDPSIDALIAKSQKQNDEMRAAINKPTSPTPAPMSSVDRQLAAYNNQPQYQSAPVSGVRENSHLPGLLGTISNGIGRAGDTAVHAASGNLGKGQNYRQTSFLPGQQ